MVMPLLVGRRVICWDFQQAALGIVGMAAAADVNKLSFTNRRNSDEKNLVLKVIVQLLTAVGVADLVRIGNQVVDDDPIEKVQDSTSPSPPPTDRSSPPCSI